MKDFSLILPTHNHPGLVKRLFNSIADTTANLNQVEIVLYLDSKDRESSDINHPLLDLVRIIRHPDAMGNILRAGYDKASARYIMLTNDDMIFMTKNCDEKVLRAFEEFPDDIGMVYGNDLYYGNMMCTFPILSRKACELMDKICPEDYKWHCIDSHILDIFKRLASLGYKRMRYLRNVVFEHMHHELSASVDDPDLKPRSDKEDQGMYFSLADKRQEIAERMAEYIRNRKGER